jgi:hypothetical protein
MKSKLNNLISQEDFKSNWRAEQAKKTKRTETGLDILNEGIEDDEVVGDRYPLSDEPGDLSTSRVEDGPDVEEIIPEGLPSDDLDIQEDIEHILNELSDLDDEIIDDVVNYLREVLLEMEQNGEIDEDFTDDLDEEHDGDWYSWIEEVIQLPELAEEAIREVSDIIFGGSRIDRVEDDEFGEDLELPDDIECPDCGGSGTDDDGDECERCGGEGRESRPFDIPPDN